MKFIYINFLFGVFIIPLQILFLQSACAASDVYDPVILKTVSNYQHMYESEISLGLDYYPIGAYNKHVGVSSSYLHYISSWNSALSIRGAYIKEINPKLKQNLIENFGVSEEQFLVMKSYLSVQYSYVPFYSKSIFFNRGLVYSRTFFNLGAGMIDYTFDKIMAVHFGFSQNYYFAQSSGFKIDFEYIAHTKSSPSITNQFLTSLSYVYSWGQIQ